jgi:hypothetical protein
VSSKPEEENGDEGDEDPKEDDLLDDDLGKVNDENLEGKG